MKNNQNVNGLQFVFCTHTYWNERRNFVYYSFKIGTRIIINLTILCLNELCCCHILLLFSIIILLLQQVLIACWQQHVLGAANENCEPPNGLQVPVVGERKWKNVNRSILLIRTSLLYYVHRGRDASQFIYYNTNI